MRHIQLFLPSPSLHSAKAYLSLNIHEQEEVHLPILQIYSLTRWFLYNLTLMGVISSSKIFAITPEQSGPPHYGLQKSTQLQEKWYQKRADRSTVPECLSSEGLWDFLSILAAMRVSQMYTEGTPAGFI